MDQLPSTASVVPNKTLMVLYTEKSEELAENSVIMPDLKGCSMTEAGRLLRSMGLQMTIHGIGICDTQSVPAGTRVAKGDSVSVHFS